MSLQPSALTSLRMAYTILEQNGFQHKKKKTATLNNTVPFSFRKTISPTWNIAIDHIPIWLSDIDIKSQRNRQIGKAGVRKPHGLLLYGNSESETLVY